MYYFRSAGNRIRETDNIILLMIGIGVGILVALAGPQFLPGLRRGIYCENVGPPSGENHRSLLALKGNDRQDLELGIQLPEEEITLGDDLEVQVIFRNEDIGPIILYIPETDPVIGTNDANIGVRLEIENVTTRQVAQDGQIFTLASRTFDDDQIHLVKSHSRCSVVTVIDGSTLAALGIGPGEYNIRAVYINTETGVAPPLEDGSLPVFASQNVWTGRAESDAVQFTVRAAPTSAPASP